MSHHSRYGKRHPNPQQQTYKKAWQAPSQGLFLFGWVDHGVHLVRLSCVGRRLSDMRPGYLAADQQQE